MAKNSTEIQETEILRQMALAQAKPARTIQTQGAIAFYSFFVVNIETNSIEQTFGFDIPPKQLRLEEDAAVDIAAAQEGGYWSDERGQYFKMLTISGTFGFRPTRKQGSSSKRVGVVAQVNQTLEAASNVASTASQVFGSLLTPESSAIQGENTGFDRLRNLTNIIRFYWDMKKNRATAAKYVFVWANWKTGEVYIAQPLRLSRDRTSPAGKFKADYTISLRLLQALEISTPHDFLPSSKTQKGLLSLPGRLGRAVDTLSGIVTLIGTIPKVATAAALGATSVLDQIVKPIEGLIGAIDSTLSNTQEAIGSLISLIQYPARQLRTVARSLLTLKGHVEGLRDLEAGFLSLDRVYTEAVWEVNAAYLALVDAILPGDVNAELRKMADVYQEWDPFVAVDKTLDRAQKVKTGDRGSGTSLGGKAVASGTISRRVSKDTTLKALAGEILGSVGQWKDIAVLNKLRPPYISARGDGVRVLRPGDLIRIPAPPIEEGDVGQVQPTVEYRTDTDAYRYGRDFLVDLTNHDLQVDEGGDLAVIDGLENLGQAMRIKIWTKPGDLKVHPWFGFEAEPGEGLSIDRLSRYSFQLRTTIASDTRVEKIKSIMLRTTGDTIYARATLIPKDQDDSIALDVRAGVGV